MRGALLARCLVLLAASAVLSSCTSSTSANRVMDGHSLSPGDGGNPWTVNGKIARGEIFDVAPAGLGLTNFSSTPLTIFRTTPWSLSRGLKFVGAFEADECFSSPIMWVIESPGIIQGRWKPVTTTHPYVSLPAGDTRVPQVTAGTLCWPGHEYNPRYFYMLRIRATLKGVQSFRGFTVMYRQDGATYVERVPQQYNIVVH